MKFNSLMLAQNRLKLLYLLRNSGFEVRMHAYEYLVAYNNKFLCLILLFPMENKAVIKIFRWIPNNSSLINEVVSTIKEIEKETEITVLAFP
ncbi:MAG: hypothetical protein QW260_01995 [Thermoproteota archaeon]